MPEAKDLRPPVGLPREEEGLEEGFITDYVPGPGTLKALLKGGVVELGKRLGQKMAAQGGRTVMSRRERQEGMLREMRRRKPPPPQESGPRPGETSLGQLKPAPSKQTEASLGFKPGKGYKIIEE